MKIKTHIYSSLSLLTFFVLFLCNPSVKAQGLNQWTALGPYTEWPYPFSRHEHAFVQARGKMYLIGGRGNKPVQIYDPLTNTWEQGAQPPLEIHHMQLVHINGKIYVIGAQTGQFPHEDPVGSVLIYNIDSDSWQWGPGIPQHRQRGSAGVVVHGGKIYVVCGIIDGHSSGWVNWLDVFDPQTGSWQQLPSAPRARDHFHAALVGDKIVVAGGRRSGASGYFNATVGEVDVYDISNNSWETIGSIPTQRAGCTSIAVGNEVIIMGGESGGQQAAHNQVQAINIDTRSWRTLDPLNQGRHGIQATIYNNAIYVAGGSIEKGANELQPTNPNYVEMYRFAPPDANPGDDDDDDDDDGPVAPWAAIEVDETVGFLPFHVNFDGSSSIDYDGEIVSYSWDFGDGSTATGENVSHTYTQLGSYTVELTVEDNDGLTNVATTEIAVLDPTKPFILFVSETNTSDQTIRDHLTGMGFNVMVEKGTSVSAEDVEGKDLIIISSTVNSNDVKDLFGDVDVPVINWEPNLYDDLLMTNQVSDNDYGWINSNNLQITDPTHPLAANMIGTVDLYTNQQHIAWGIPLNSAAQVGNYSLEPSKYGLFAYDQGAPLANGTLAPARRVGFPLGDNSAPSFTENGWLLFDVAVCWAMECNPINIEATVEPQSGPLPLTVNFDASASSHLYGNIVSYLWQFGVGSDFSFDTTTTYTYNNIGDYYAKLILTDQYGNIAVDSFLIEVLPAPPTAVWTAAGDSVFAPATVQFDARNSFDVDGEIIQYYWSFGDGTNDSLIVADSIHSDSLLLDSLLQPTHTYTHAGEFVSMLKAIDNDGGVDFDTVVVHILNTAPVAMLNADTSGYAPLVATLDASLSYDPDGDITQYVFNYGDGFTDTVSVDASFHDSLLVKEHIYSLSGTFGATLTVIDNLGASHSATVQIEVLNTAPSAHATANLYEGLAPLTVIFYSDSSVDSDGEIIQTIWDLPNGNMDSTAETAFTFERWGTYTVGLSVTDNGGLVDEDHITINILNQAPEAVASADRLSGVYPLAVNFSGENSTDIDGDIVEYIWEINDSTTLNGDSVHYVFENEGTYTVYLTVIDDAGDSSQTSIEIIAKPESRDLLFVTAQPEETLNTGDAKVKELLEAMNFNVIVKVDSESQTEDAEDKVLVIISSTCQSGDVHTKFTEVATPVLTWESYLYDDLNMTNNSGSSYGYINGVNSIQILDATHPLSAGLSGEQMVYPSTGMMVWGTPLSTAINIAALADDPSKSVIFGYEAGSQLNNSIAPERRVGFMIQDTEAVLLTDAGVALFEAAVCWATGCSSQPEARKMTAANVELKAYPVPLRKGQALTIEFSIDKDEQVGWMIVDAIGKIHQQKSQVLKAGTYRQAIHVEKLSTGIYTLVVRRASGIQSKKIVIVD